MLVKIIIGIILIALLVLNLGLGVFVIVGLLPAGAAYLVDIRPGKNFSATIFFFNLTGLTLGGMPFIKNGMMMRFPEDSLNIRSQCMVYIFAGMGYAIVWLVPKITVILVDYKNERRAVKIRDKITKIVEEWGDEVRN